MAASRRQQDQLEPESGRGVRRTQQALLVRQVEHHGSRNQVGQHDRVGWQVGKITGHALGREQRLSIRAEQPSHAGHQHLGGGASHLVEEVDVALEVRERFVDGS